MKWALLLHENEPDRVSNTSRLISQVLPECETFIWQRKEPPAKLLSLLQNEQYQPWLLFPADRPELVSRAKTLEETQKTPLIIIPDGTWKEVRKIVRKSPWLDEVPLLSFSPEKPSRYDLRRNPDANHLCTAEIAAELLEQSGNPVAAMHMNNALDLFLKEYRQWQRSGKPMNKPYHQESSI